MSVDFFRNIKRECFDPTGQHWLPENTVEIERKALRQVADRICQSGECRYPLLALRLLIYVITGVDANGKICLSSRQLSKKMNAHYDTVNKCLKYLKEIGVLQAEK